MVILMLCYMVFYGFLIGWLAGLLLVIWAFRGLVSRLQWFFT